MQGVLFIFGEKNENQGIVGNDTLILCAGLLLAARIAGVIAATTTTGIVSCYKTAVVVTASAEKNEQ